MTQPTRAGPAPVNPITLKAAMAVLRPIFGGYIHTHVSGRERLPPAGVPTIVAVNHTSNLDVFATGYAVNRPAHFIAKAEATRVPLFGRFLLSVGAIPANRDQRDTAALRQTLEVLQRGGLFGIAPEGTRSPDGKLSAYDPGFVWLAVRTGALIVPTAIHGAYALWPRGAGFPRRGDLWIRFGEPISPAAEGRPTRERLEALAEDVRRRTLSLLADLVAETGVPNPAVASPTEPV